MAPNAKSLESVIESLQVMLQKNTNPADGSEASSDSEQSQVSSTDESTESNQTSSSEDHPSRGKVVKRKKSSKKGVSKAKPTDIQSLSKQLLSLQKQLKKQKKTQKSSKQIQIESTPESSEPIPVVTEPSCPPVPSPLSVDDAVQALLVALGHQQENTENEPAKRGTKIEFKRVDQVWDNEIHNYKLQETVGIDGQMNNWDQYTFTVRRRFDLEGKYIATFVDIKSKTLKDCLRRILNGVKGASLHSDIPAIDPKLLFLYLEEMRELKKVLKIESKSAQEKKERREATSQLQHLTILLKYLDDDFADTKRNLNPMLEAGTITYDYLWALFKPGTMAFSYTYSDEEEPRAFKIESSQERCSFVRGSWYSIEGKFLDFDGKSFGLATIFEDVSPFQGERKITSLPCYPLTYHKNSEQTRTKLIERGKKFVSLQGMNYKSYSGMSYCKKKDKILRVDINGRVMIDPAVFRRVNPNYPLSSVKMPDGDVIDIDDDPEYANSLDTTTTGLGQLTPTSEDSERQKQFKVAKDQDGNHIMIEVSGPVEDNLAGQTLDDKSMTRVFTEEELLITNPVVLGFSFSEKLWLEFAISKVGEVQWNEGAFESLILPDSHKSIVKALVSSHAFHPSRSIDDIIAGKGKGLVAVLHGGPGLGKTLTVESIADLLKRPLYVVSVGDLGTDSTTLERELQNILDIAHSWGAVLLLDEADVFLERRSVHDMFRNALVSIFLRQLEYFQGILFLTTNRVEVFDEAFVSRIHLSLRYNDLSTKAKKSVWKTFIEKVKNAEGMEVETIPDTAFDDLARRNLNGRQIKNIVRAAQALAIHEDCALSLTHIKTVIDVAQSFERDLKGGNGWEEAMRGYT